MKKKALAFASSHQQFVRYCLIGVSGVALDFTVFALLFNVFNMNAIAANIISTSCGIVNNFLLNRHYNFKKKDFILLRFLSFFATGLTGILVSSAIIRTFHDYAGWNANLVKLGAIFVVVVLQYGLNKHISFRDIKRAHGSSLRVIGGFIKANWLPITAFAIAATVFALYIPKDVLGTDESDNFLSAKLILSGDFPYRDFFSHHMPTTYFIAVLFYVLGNGDPLAFRMVFTGTLFAWLAWNFWMIRYYGKSKTAASVYVLLVGLAHGLLLQHMMLAETFIFYAVTTVILALLFVPTERLKRPAWLWTLALLLASLPLFAVAYIYVAAILYLFAAVRLIPGTRLITAARYVLIAAAPFVAFGAYVLATGTHVFLFDNIRFNALYYGPFFGDMGSSPVMVGYHILTKTFDQLQNVITGAFTTHFIPLVYVLAFLSLPVCLWASGKRRAAGFTLALLFFANARVGLFGPPGIEQSFAVSISQHAELYRGLSLLFVSLSLAYVSSANAKAWLKKYSVYGLALTSLAILLVIIPINLVSAGNTYYTAGGSGLTQNIRAYRALPGKNIAVINAVATPHDRVWIGPIDFLGQTYIHAQRATNYTFFMPWHHSCPSCHDEFYSQLAQQKPLVISWHPGADTASQHTPGYTSDMRRFLDAHYFHIRTSDPAFTDLYFLDDQEQLIHARLKEAHYGIE